MKHKRHFEITSFALHILAMALMLCDHAWATIALEQEWLTGIGRIAFPIFAFLIVEGWFHTKSRKKYTLRLLIFALISEIPFNFMMSGTWLYPYHQNVLWTFLIGVGCMALLDWARGKKRVWPWLLAVPGVLLGCLIALLGMTDYMHYGVLTVLAFYLFRDRRWWQLLGQLVCLWYINFELFGSQLYLFELFGREWELPQQGLAVLALIPIWLYRGRQGPYNRTIKYLNYAFYPVHMAALVALAYLLH